MILVKLFEDAIDAKDRRDFVLTTEDIRQIDEINDQDVVSLMLWLKKKKASSQVIDTDITDDILWLKLHMKEVNLRTKMHCFVRFLAISNPMLKSSLNKVLAVL